MIQNKLYALCALLTLTSIQNDLYASQIAMDIEADDRHYETGSGVYMEIEDDCYSQAGSDVSMEIDRDLVFSNKRKRSEWDDDNHEDSRSGKRFEMANKFVDGSFTYLSNIVSHTIPGGGAMCQRINDVSKAADYLVTRLNNLDKGSSNNNVLRSNVNKIVYDNHKTQYSIDRNTKPTNTREILSNNNVIFPESHLIKTQYGYSPQKVFLKENANTKREKEIANAKNEERKTKRLMKLYREKEIAEQNKKFERNNKRIQMQSRKKKIKHIVVKGVVFLAMTFGVTSWIYQKISRFFYKA